MSHIPTFDFSKSPVHPGLTVIEASAGTGKTFAISHLVPRLLLEKRARSLDEILLVTFTNAATAELAQRVRSVLETLHAAPSAEESIRDPGVATLREKFEAEQVEKVIGQALMDFDRLNVCTIHSFCLQVLQTEGNLCGLPAVPDLVPDVHDRIDQWVTEHWEAEIAPNELLAAIAHIGGWSRSEDQKFCSMVGDDFEATFEPPGETYRQLLDECSDLFSELSEAAVEELEAILKPVGKWNKAYPGDEARDRALKQLRDAAREGGPAARLSATLFFDQAVEWIPKRSKAQKECVEKLKRSELHRIASGVRGWCQRKAWSHQLNVLNSVRERQAKYLKDNRLITYNGLVRQVHRALTELPGSTQLAAALRERFKVGLIDESQDTDPHQYGIFKRIFLDPEDPRTLLLIGDPKQAIYGFRGADLNTYLRAREEAGEGVYSLTQTFRAPQPLVSCVNALFSGNRPFYDKALRLLPASSGLKADNVLLEGGQVNPERMVCWVPDAETDASLTSKDNLKDRLAKAVADTIARLLKGDCQLADFTKEDPPEPVRPAHCAVLVADRHDATAVRDALKEHRIPAVTARNVDIMTSEEAGDLLALLKVVLEPKNTSLLSVALTRPMIGKTAAELQLIMDNPDQIVAIFSDALNRWQTEGIASAMAWLDAKLAISQSCASLPDAERHLSNYRQLQDLLVRVEAEEDRQPEGILRWMSAAISSSSDSEERQMQLETDAEAVQIVTMHAAKGLEFPLVFCPFLWKTSPLRAHERLNRPGEPPHYVHTGLCEDDKTLRFLHDQHLCERLRLAYVALTRARVKVWCFAGHGGSRKDDMTALWAWLLDRGENQWGVDEVNDYAGGVLNGLQDQLKDPSWLAVQGLPAEMEPIDATTGETSPGNLHALPEPRIPEAWGLTSFSALTHEKSPFAGEDVPGVESVDDAVPANPMSPLPGGVNLGTAVHDWLEQWDFSELNPAALVNHLRDYPLGEPARQEAVADALVRVLNDLRSARLPGLDTTVGEACPEADASEWIFHLPLRDRFSVQEVAAVFRRHGYSQYALQLKQLPESQLRGFLHGFIDRIVFRGESWGVIDWKTNNLGIGASAYAEPSLQTCVEQQHYLLQAVLYLLALRRFLPEGTVLAGAWVVFLRGIQADSSAGILHIHPPPELLRELDELFVKPS